MLLEHAFIVKDSLERIHNWKILNNVLKNLNILANLKNVLNNRLKISEEA